MSRYCGLCGRPFRTYYGVVQHIRRGHKVRHHPAEMYVMFDRQQAQRIRHRIETRKDREE